MFKRKHQKLGIKFRQSLFWDVNPQKINPKKHSQYIIERIFDLGNDQELKWAIHYYPIDLIKKTIKKSRVLHNKSKSLWSLIFR